MDAETERIFAQMHANSILHIEDEPTNDPATILEKHFELAALLSIHLRPPSLPIPDAVQEGTLILGDLADRGIDGRELIELLVPMIELGLRYASERTEILSRYDGSRLTSTKNVSPSVQPTEDER